MPLVEISQEQIDKAMKEGLNKAYNIIYRKLYNKTYYETKKNRTHKENIVKDVINNRNETDHSKDNKNNNTMTIERKTVIIKFT